MHSHPKYKLILGYAFVPSKNGGLDINKQSDNCCDDTLTFQSQVHHNNGTRLHEGERINLRYCLTR